ncbi:MAG: cytochrome c [Burkholderiaceae bacterium]
MNKTTKFPSAARLVLAGLAAMSLAAPVLAGDIEKGREKAEQICAACHGKDGNTPIDPSYPKLGGQFEDYLETAMIDYQVGRRTHAIMAGQAKMLTREEIRNLAAYYSSLPSQLTVHRR